MNNELWIFDGGESFSGNPKWLFMYMNDHHKEIKIYWFSRSEKTIKYVKKLGFKACGYNTKYGKKIMKKATCYVVNQVKEIIPSELRNCKILNLWHGVGCKSIERKVTTGFLKTRIAKKYITNNEIYKKNQLFLVTSPIMEKHFKNQCGIDDDMVIRGGYPCNMYQGHVKTFDHNILKRKKLNEDTKIIVYSPTYRDNGKNDFFGKAIPDMEKLIDILEKKNILFIFKMHPFMLEEQAYINAQNTYGNCQNILFWDNSNDFYEIMDQVDLAIIDYSSIFYDMLACGVPNFIRYIFDYDDKNNFRDLVFDYKKMTCGECCYSFDELIKLLKNIDKTATNPKDINKIMNKFWAYQTDNSFEDIINQTLAFKIDEDKPLKTLYSFDIFDTLISRKSFAPKSIFQYIKEFMYNSDLKFKPSFIKCFVAVRMDAESNVRDRKKKDPAFIKNKNFEITLAEIYDRIQKTHKITNKQKKFLIDKEIEAELANVEPLKDKIDYLLELYNNGEDVILISDMYLPKEVITGMLKKANPTLTKIPLYLSSENKVQKTTKELYLTAYFDQPEYNYKKWIHYGDNPNADSKQASQLGIKAVLHNVPKFNKYENSLIEYIDTYDSYVLANILRKHRLVSKDIDHFNYSYTSLFFVSYVHWAIKDAIKNKIDCLYFISRDGHHLKNIADTIIGIKKYKIKTKYIYGSRKAWRLPAYIDSIDDAFFSEYGALSSTIKSFKELLTNLYISEKEFDSIFPELEYLKRVRFNSKLIESIRPIIKNSTKYSSLLLKKATKKRPYVIGYLNQEINFNESFAFVEYWGRGYTQTSLHNLLKQVNPNHQDTIFYYLRSIYDNEENIIRKNYISKMVSLIPIEAIFSNLPYSSITEYKKVKNKYVPVIKKNDNVNMPMFESLSKNLVDFCNDFYSQKFLNEADIERSMLLFALKYFNTNYNDSRILKYLAPLKDSVTSNGEIKEFAPEITLKHFFLLFKAIKIESHTSNIKMSLARSTKRINKLYLKYRKVYTSKKFKKFWKWLKKIFKI